MHVLSKPRRILITGASRGIGRATALHLASQGHSVILAARQSDSLEQAAREALALGGRVEVVCLDVTDEREVNVTIARLLEVGPIDVVVNNAGTCVQREFLEQTPEEQRSEMDLNYFGVQNVTRAVLPAFIKRGEGYLVNVSSLLGTSAAPTTANYSASKAALEAFSDGLRGEVRRSGIHVTVFVAPPTQTELGHGTEFRGVAVLPAAYVAQQLAHAIHRMPRRAAAGPIYGALLRVAGWFPGWMERQMCKSVAHLLAAPKAFNG